jgi:hypothetical protein
LERLEQDVRHREHLLTIERDWLARYQELQAKDPGSKLHGGQVWCQQIDVRVAESALARAREALASFNAQHAEVA